MVAETKNIFEMIRRMWEIWFIIFSCLGFIDLENKVPWQNGPNWLKHDSQTRLMLLMPEGGWPQFHLIILINNVCFYCITQKKKKQKAQSCFTFWHVERLFSVNQSWCRYLIMFLITLSLLWRLKYPRYENGGVAQFGGTSRR